MVDVLKRYMEQNDIVSIYTKADDPDDIFCGRICAVSDAYVLIANIGSDGMYEGHSVFEVERVHRVDAGGKYEKKIALLYELKKQSHPRIADSLQNPLVTLFSHAKANRSIVSCEVHQSGDLNVRGFAKAVDENLVTIDVVSSYGIDDGESILCVDAITMVHCDSSSEMDAKLLYDTRCKGAAEG